MAAGCSGRSDATGGYGAARNPQNPELPATDALIEKLRVRQAVLARVRSIALRPEERQVLTELLDETSAMLAVAHGGQVTADLPATRELLARQREQRRHLHVAMTRCAGDHDVKGTLLTLACEHGDHVESLVRFLDEHDHEHRGVRDDDRAHDARLAVEQAMRGAEWSRLPPVLSTEARPQEVSRP